MKMDNYKKYIEEINRNNEIKKRLQGIPDIKQYSIFKPILVCSIAICIVIISALGFRDITTKSNDPKLPETSLEYRKGRDGIIYLKESTLTAPATLSETPEYETLPVFTNGFESVRNGVALLTKEQVENEYLPKLESFLDLDSSSRIVDEEQYGEGQWCYYYGDTVTLMFSSDATVGISLANIEQRGITQEDDAVEFAKSMLHEFTGFEYEGYHMQNTIGESDSSSKIKYLTRSKVSDILKTYYAMDFNYYTTEKGAEFFLVLPTDAYFQKRKEVPIMSSKVAFDELKKGNNYFGTIMSGLTDEAFLKPSDEIAAELDLSDLINVSLYYNMNMSNLNYSYGYTYPIYQFTFAIPEYTSPNMKEGEVATITMLAPAVPGEYLK